MPDEITIIQKTDSGSTTATPPENQSSASVRAQLTSLCALGLGLSFFLPWANILSVNISGFTLQKAGNGELLLWLIPLFSLITVIVGVTKHSQKIVGQLTGLLPFIVGAYWYRKFGNDLFQILSVGAYLSLIFGAGLFILPRKSK